MPSRRRIDPAELRAAMLAVRPWLDDAAAAAPARADVAAAVRLSLRTLAHVAPGSSVEVRVPPYSAVQCVSGPRHTRGTPPNVVETDPRTWLLLATGRWDWAEALRHGALTASGARADVSGHLPLVRVGDATSVSPREQQRDDARDAGVRRGDDDQ